MPMIRSRNAKLAARCHCAGGAMPIVAMTREMGSPGKDVAAHLAERIEKPLLHTR
jgi:hypothetical protein